MSKGSGGTRGAVTGSSYAAKGVGGSALSFGEYSSVQKYSVSDGVMRVDMGVSPASSDTVYDTQYFIRDGEIIRQGRKSYAVDKTKPGLTTRNVKTSDADDDFAKKILNGMSSSDKKSATILLVRFRK